MSNRSLVMHNLKRRRGEGSASAAQENRRLKRVFAVVIAGLMTAIWMVFSRLLNISSNASSKVSLIEYFNSLERDYGNSDQDCIYRNSPIHRKVFVYPNPGESEWNGDILSPAGQNLSSLEPWPWLELDRSARENSRGHYNIMSPNIQYTTELLVRELMVNPKSCLRTLDPEKATLFYVPYLPSIEHHVGHDSKTDYAFSPYGKAIIEIIDNQDYTEWENMFGLTSKYWKRRNGSDHILVFSEPMHGLFHPRNRRGNYHFVHSQKQLAPPIVVSVELSATFVSMYPKCAAKNILVPYPNTHGDWFNGGFVRQAQKLLEETNVNTENSRAALPVERLLRQQGDPDARALAQYYSAGNHGTCRKLRKAMQSDYVNCAPSHKELKEALKNPQNSVGMRLTTFCPAPGGDSPSAKRMFDALIAGCIPVILSEDFVWPSTKEFDPLLQLDPSDFSLRLNASDFDEPLLDSNTCQPLNESRPGLQAYFESISNAELNRLRQGVQKAGKLFSWYKESEHLPTNPLKERILPDGGAAFFVVQALAERSEGQRWPACAEELKLPRGPDPMQFKC
jgi:Exostosin family